MYAILRAKKIKTHAQISNAVEHNLRLRTQANIDCDRSHLNKILFNPLEVDHKSATNFREKLFAFYEGLKIKEKKDNVLLYEYVATASPKFFENKNDVQVSKWAEDQLTFMKNEFGSQLKFAVIHHDEKTPHIHFFVSTELKSVKRYKNQKGEFHKENWSLNSKRYDPAFLVELQTRYAQANKHWGLVRGVRNSVREHVPLKKFYAMVDRAMTTSYKKQVDRLIELFELSLTDRFSLSSIRDKLRSYLAPHIENFARQQKTSKEMVKLDVRRFHNELVSGLESVKIEKELLLSKRDLYREAINRRLKDIELTELLAQQNEQLKKRLNEIEAERIEKQSKISGKPITPNFY